MTAGRLLDLSASAPSAAACLGVICDGGAGTAADQAVARATQPEEEWLALDACGAALVAVGDRDYPAALLDLYDPPAALFIRGTPTWWASGGRSAAIVGARSCSAYGVEMAETLAAGLATAGIAAVSGGARGIDSAAHRGALDAGGLTIAVLGCGLDQPYPPGNRKLLEAIAEKGALVTEYAPRIRAEPFRFPARNRLIAALSEAVVVVEGTSGSGSMITAEHAIALGRQVLAVPGPVTSELSQAPLALIREGASLVRGPVDLLDDMRVLSGGGEDDAAGPKGRIGAPTAEATEREGAPMGWSPTPDERAVLKALAGAQPADIVAMTAGLPLPRVLSVLVGLEVRGLVRSVGGRFERTLHPAR
jgi:DNA processing protein